MLKAASDTQIGPDWPALLRMRPHTAVLAAAGFLLAVWVAVIAVDAFGVVAPGHPAWMNLFNNSVVEWVQYVYEALATVAAAYLAGRLAGRHPGAASFFFVISVGVGLMLIEDASDVRLHTANFLTTVFGEDGRLFGQHPYLYGTVLILAVLAFFPLYALGRYDKYAWRAPTVRPYLTGAFAFYGVSQVMSFLSHQGGFYYHLGGAIHDDVFGGRLPIDPTVGKALSNYLIVDSSVEETLELLGIGCLFAMILAFAADLRAGRIADAEPAARPAERS